MRAAAVYRDRLTGAERLFIGIGVLGIFSGQYDASVPGKVKWSSLPEHGPTRTRILAIVEANGSLYYSEGTKVFRRIDGPAPRYEEVADMMGEADPDTDRKQFQSIGGIRGMSAIEGPVSGQQSLIFFWAGGRRSAGCIFRLDPRADGSFARVRETCLADLVSQHLGGASIPFVLGAYNSFMPLRDPSTGNALHLIGLEAFIADTPGGRFSNLIHLRNRSGAGGFYGGGLYALRDAQGRWRLGEVSGPYAPGRPALEAVYTYAMSPFSSAGASTIYLGGYDGNHMPAHDTAWVYSTDLTNLLLR